MADHVSTKFFFVFQYLNSNVVEYVSRSERSSCFLTWPPSIAVSSYSI